MGNLGPDSDLRGNQGLTLISISCKDPMRFQGSPDYVATADLALAVNAAVTLQRPLLVKGEPGTGKTMLAIEVAKALEMPLLQWHIKSTTKAQQGLYEYDAVSRLRDSQLAGVDSGRVLDIRNYIVKGVLWQAFESDVPCVLLIDEIDKADIEFPNDLLRELDRMEFYVYETQATIRARHRPLRGLHHFLRLVDIELHAVELEQQVVGELDVGLVDLVDQQHDPRRRRQRLAERAELDVLDRKSVV